MTKPTPSVDDLAAQWIVYFYTDRKKTHPIMRKMIKLVGKDKALVAITQASETARILGLNR